MSQDQTPGAELTPAVRVSGLDYRYPDGKDALAGRRAGDQPGESVALVGPNGAGRARSCCT